MAGLIQNVKLFGEDIPWFQGLRDKGLEAFRRQGVPTAKTEAWKYTKPRDLNADDYVMDCRGSFATFEPLSFLLTVTGYVLKTGFLIPRKPICRRGWKLCR